MDRTKDNDALSSVSLCLRASNPPLPLSHSLSLPLPRALSTHCSGWMSHDTPVFFPATPWRDVRDAIFSVTDLLPLRNRRARVRPPGKHRRRPCAVTRLSHDTSVRRGRRWQSEPVAPRAPAPSRTNGRPPMRGARAAALQRRPEYHGTGIRAPTARTDTCARTCTRAPKSRAGRIARQLHSAESIMDIRTDGPPGPPSLPLTASNGCPLVRSETRRRQRLDLALQARRCVSIRAADVPSESCPRVIFRSVST